MPDSGERIACMYVPPDSMRLIAEDQAECLLYFTEIFLRIDAHQGARRTVLFARIGWPFCTRGIERSAFAQIALDGYHVLAFGGRGCGWRARAEQTSEPSQKTRRHDR